LYLGAVRVAYGFYLPPYTVRRKDSFEGELIVYGEKCREKSKKSEPNSCHEQFSVNGEKVATL
jgi:hypothetical protein